MPNQRWRWKNYFNRLIHPQKFSVLDCYHDNCSSQKISLKITTLCQWCHRERAQRVLYSFWMSFQDIIYLERPFRKTRDLSLGHQRRSKVYMNRTTVIDTYLIFKNILLKDCFPFSEQLQFNWIRHQFRYCYRWPYQQPQQWGNRKSTQW